MSQKIGFIGLGIMGRPMARRLLSAGVSLLVNDVEPSAARELTAGGARFATLGEIGEECGIVFTILPNGTVVQEVLFGEQGVARGLRPGSLVVDMSSVTPSESQNCAKLLEAQGCRFLDSPVSGGEPGAVNGTLAFMVGGHPGDFERAKPFFEIMGSSSMLIGPNGSGSVTKLANQIIVNMGIAAVSEALVLATKAGADPGLVFRAIRGGLAGSAVLEAKAPMMLRRDFRPGGKIAINHKDIKNVIDTAHRLDVPLPLTAQLFEVMQALKVDGHMQEDHSGIVQYFERLAGVVVRSDELEEGGL